tara:strand:+ start:6979 stop:7359 length:381 start_codon:yes stop_codon:yes gene_type:complete
MMETQDLELQRNRLRIYAMKLFGLQLSPAASMFGEIAQVLGVINQAQLRAALKLQETFRGNGKSIPRVGEILLDQGLLDQNQLETVLDEQERISSTCDDSEETRLANLAARARRLNKKRQTGLAVD